MFFRYIIYLEFPKSLLDIGREYASGKAKTEDSDARAIYSKAGEFLRQLHESETCDYTQNDLDDLINYIRERLLNRIFTKKEEAELSHYLTQVRADIKGRFGQYRKNSVHSDFGPGNILSHGKDINVLDFGDYRLDHGFYDIAYFKMMLERQLENPIRYKKAARDELLRAFGKGYGIDFRTNSEDNLYKLFQLKIMAIFIKALTWKEWHGTSLFSFKNRISNFLEYNKIKREILLRVR